MAEPDSDQTTETPLPAPPLPNPPLPAPPLLVTLVPDTSPKAASPIFSQPPSYFADVLEDAEWLLKYAAEAGMPVEDSTRDHVLQARAASDTGWSEERIANLLAALATLAALVKPVTAASLRACSAETGKSMSTYTTAALCLALVIVPFSVASFLASSISNSVRTDIATANDLAVKLQEQLGYPPNSMPPPPRPCTAFPIAPKADTPTNVNKNDIISELQLYASTIRSIDAHAQQLDVLLFNSQKRADPCQWLRSSPVTAHAVFQLPPGLPNLAQAALDRTTLYQDVRYFAQNLLDNMSFFYGSITTCILPVLYALLGTCAYLLRDFEQQMTARTFVPSRANFARFLIAGIGGAVVGLFNNFAITQGASIPPLAIAFMVGYAVDVFFAFLEGLVKSFTRSAPASTLPVPGSGSKPA
jgi:hypothetical protein